MSDIFVSYAEEDRTHAERLARALEERGWSVWWDRSIPTGRAFADVIEEALEAARCVLVLWSERSVASRWVKTEAEEGAKRDILVPIRIQDVEIPLAFRSFQAADLIGWEGASGAPEIETLVADIAALVDQPPAGSGRSEEQTDPARGRRDVREAVPTDGSQARQWRGRLLLAVALIAVVFGLWNLLDLPQVPDLGFWWGRGNKVARVFENSPAERAGLERGDVVTRVNGDLIDDWDWSRRPAIGDTRTFEVERDGQRREFRLTVVGLPARLWARSILLFAVGVCVVALGLWAYFECPSTTTWVLALFGLSFSPIFLGFLGLAPESTDLQRFRNNLSNSLIVLSLALLVHFLLLFPKRRSLLDKAWGLSAVYAPAVVVALVYVAELLTRTSKLGQAVNLVFAGYFACVLVLVTASFVRATPGECTEQGLSLMLIGVVFGLLPPAVVLLMAQIDRIAALPGVEFYGLALGLIPIACSIAVVREHKTALAAVG